MHMDTEIDEEDGCVAADVVLIATPHRQQNLLRASTPAP